VTQLAKANINALLDQAEDPQKMLDQLIRDYSNNISEAEEAVAATIGNLRLMEQDHDEDVAAAAEWGGKALAASKKADELRTAGSTADADRFDNLAKVALGRQVTSEKEAKTAEPVIASQTEIVGKLKSGLDQMRTKLGELQGRRDSLVARAKSAQAQNQMMDAAKNINVLTRQRAGPLRGQGPARGGQGQGQGGAGRVLAGRPVREPRHPLGHRGGRRPARRPQGGLTVPAVSTCSAARPRSVRPPASRHPAGPARTRRSSRGGCGGCPSSR